MRVNVSDVQSFWNSHPSGRHIVGGLHRAFAHDYERFLTTYDTWRYEQESHIPACLGQVDWRGKRVLGIGLGQGAESEQIIRRGSPLVRSGSQLRAGPLVFTLHACSTSATPTPGRALARGASLGAPAGAGVRGRARGPACGHRKDGQM